MKRLAWIVTLAACARPVPPAIGNTSPETSADPMAGSYRASHSIWMVCDTPDGCEEQVEDTLAIQPRGGGKLHVAIELVRTNAHTCTFEGELTPTAATQPGERRWRFESPDGSDDGPCHLDLVHTGSTIDVSANGCRYYCGARATLDAQFPYPPTRT